MLYFPQVYYNHTGWLACIGQSDLTSSGSGVKEVNYTKVNLFDLHPYSTYNITIKVAGITHAHEKC